MALNKQTDGVLGIFDAPILERKNDGDPFWTQIDVLRD